MEQLLLEAKTIILQRDLEDFWIEIAESSVNVIPDMFSFDYVDQTHQLDFKRSSSASLNAAIFGVPKFFVPRWFNWNVFQYKNSHDSNILPHQWTYIYDNTPLGKTLEKYIDFKKLSPNVKKVDDIIIIMQMRTIIIVVFHVL